MLQLYALKYFKIITRSNWECISIMSTGNWYIAISKTLNWSNIEVISGRVIRCNIVTISNIEGDYRHILTHLLGLWGMLVQVN